MAPTPLVVADTELTGISTTKSLFEVQVPKIDNAMKDSGDWAYFSAAEHSYTIGWACK